jgi:PAS domain S-box-containing protein
MKNNAKNLLDQTGGISRKKTAASLTGDSAGMPGASNTEANARTERELQFTQFVIDNMSDACYWATSNGRMIYVNDAACSKLGYSKAELLEKSIIDIVPEYTQAAWSLQFESIKQAGTQVFETRHKKKNGQSFPVEMRTNYVQFEGKEYVCGITHDLTDSKRNEAARQALQEIMQGQGKTEDLREYLKLVHQTIAKVIVAENFYVILKNKGTGMFDEIYSSDKYDPPSQSSMLEKSISAYVFRSGKPLLLNQERFEELVARGEVELVGANSPSWLGVPLITSRETIGVMAVQDYEKIDRYSEEDKEFLVTISRQIAQIIERKNAELALRASEEKWHSLVMAIPDYISIHDSDGKFLFLNHDASRVIEKEVLGHSVYDFVTANSKPIFKKEMDDVKKTGEMRKFEYQAYVNQGEVRDYEAYLIPWKSPTGEIETLAFARDITDRNRTEEMLLENEERYRDLVENSQELIYTHDLYGQFLSVNHTAAHRLGYSPLALVGKNLRELQAANKDSHLDDYLEKLRLRGSAEGVWFLKSGTGEERAWEYISTLRSDAKQGPYVRGIARDITERLQAEEFRRNSEARLRFISEKTADVIWVLDPVKGYFTYVSPSVEKMRGYTPAEVMSQPIELAFTPESLKLVKSHRDDRLAAFLEKGTGSESFTDLIDQPCKDGSIVNTEVVTTYLFNENHQVEIVGVTRDITARKHAEQRQEAIQQVLRTVSSQLDIDILVQAAMETVAKGTGYPHVCLVLPEENGTAWVVSGAAGRLKATKGYIGRNHQGVIGRAFKTGENQWVRDILQDPDYVRAIDASDGPALRSEMVALLKHGNKIIGALNIESDLVDGFTEEDALMIQSLADEIALALENAYLYRQAQQEINDRKGVEMALRESENRYRAAFDGVEDAIFIEALDGRILDVNQRACEMYGYSHAEFLTKAVADLVPSENNIIHVDPKNDHSLPRHPIETVNLRANGQIFPIELNIRLHHLNNEQVLFVVGRDVTDRKRIQEALFDSQEQYRLLFENSLDAVLLTLPDGSILTANPSACRMFGSSEKELRELGRDGLIDPSDPRLNLAIEERARTGSFTGELTGLRNDGSKFPLEISSSTFKNRAGTVQASMILRDITERKQAEDALRTSEADLAEAQRVAGIGSWRFTVSDGGMRWSDELYRIFDDDRSENNLTYGSFLSHVHPDDRELIINTNRLARENGEPFDMEYRIITRTGDIKYIREFGQAVKDQAGKVQSLFGTAQDITERKHFEADLAASREQLRALSQYLQEAREEERTIISREIHDELGQELTALKMDLAWIAKQLPADCAQLIEKTTDMSAMVDGTIQTVRRVASQLRPRMLDDLGLVAALEGQAGEFQSRTGIGCTLALAEDVSELNRDQATAIFRIFQEVLTNIARHSQATKIRVVLKEKPDGIHLDVNDNGIGITDSQVNDPLSLGLIGMRERVQSFGGTLGFKSAPGKGTSVRMVMPQIKTPLDKEA